MKKNNTKTIIKRILFVLFTPIAFIFIPYLIGDAILSPDVKPNHVIPIVWLLGALMITLAILFGTLLFYLAKPIYEWIVYQKEE